MSEEKVVKKEEVKKDSSELAEKSPKEKVVKKEEVKKEPLSFRADRDYKEPELVVDEFLLKNKTIDSQKARMRRSLGMAVSKKKEEKLNYYRRLKLRLYSAGVEVEPEPFVRKIMLFTIIFVTVLTFGVGIWAILDEVSVIGIVVLLLVFWLLGFFIFNYLFILLAQAYLSYRSFVRTKEVERVLPEFLRLVATNYRSGLPLDKALIASTRARFGILSKEMEQIAKTTRVKGDLAKALEVLGKKFDSRILERAMSSISSSIHSGANISELLDEIANNITKMRNMQASMAANVKNYVIFIVIAGIVIAPFMFAMSYQMNNTIGDVKGRLEGQLDSTASAGVGLGVVEGGGVNPNNFDVFAILMILTNCVISSMIISMIKHGNFQQGFRNVFFFMALSLSFYFIGKWVLSGVIGVV